MVARMARRLPVRENNPAPGKQSAGRSREVVPAFDEGLPDLGKVTARQPAQTRDTARKCTCMKVEKKASTAGMVAATHTLK